MFPLLDVRDGAWCRALTLAERIALVGGAAKSNRGDEDLGRRRLERLRAGRPFSDDDVFRTWLEANGWSEEDLLRGLGARPENLQALAGGEIPEWWAELTAAYTRPVRPGAPRVVPADPDPPQRAFAQLWHPLAVRAGDRLYRRAAALAAADTEVPFEPGGAVALLIESLVGQLYEISLRTLVLELNVARLGGHLDGASGGARFQSFVERLERADVAQALFGEYPVLGRLAVEAAERWFRFSLELLEHLVEDRRLLEETFHGGAPLGTLQGLRGGAGDRHRAGRSVQILDFDSGLRLVYKPRSLSVDRHFQALLAWLDQRGDHLPSRPVALVDGGTYGWVEFVPVEDCESPEAVERFYERQGGHLALLYALDANDFHFENVIANGEHPVLVDLESLFAQRLQPLDWTTAPGRASYAIVHSVLRTGLLPQPRVSGDRFQGVDTSGLGGRAGQTGPAYATPEATATDRMHLARRALPFGGGENLPALAGEPQAALDHVEAIERGFGKVYATLLAHREELLAPDGPLAAFAGDHVRLILRPTQTYRMMELDSYHPDLLRDALERGRHFDRLWLGLGSKTLRPFIIQQECLELSRLDVPMFTTRPGERRLFSGTGRCLDDHFEASGLEIVSERLERFGDRDLELQRWMIGASLAALATARPQAERVPVAALERREPAGASRLLAAAARIRDRLREISLLGSTGERSWVGIAGTDEQHFCPVPLGFDLYSGVPGITLFLAYLGAVTRDDEARELAEATWETHRRALAEGPEVLSQLGPFTGLGGVVFLALHLSRLWRRPDLLQVAAQAARWIEERLPEDEGVDVLSGSAGCIPVLLSLERATGEGCYLELAKRCGDRVLRAARELPEGIGWTSGRVNERPLSGFSHGGAGFAWALAQLARATGDGRFERAVHAAHAYERSLFDPAEGNWRDLRSFRGPDGGFSIAWCHGAVGIGLARMADLALEDDDEEWAVLRGELEIALETTLGFGIGSDHSLCHGSLGNAELLAAAGRLLDRPLAMRRAGQIAAVVCDEVEAGRFRCGVPGGCETPGLMDGLAGIGYGLLRLAVPSEVPSVLLLEPPVGIAPIRAPRRRRSEALTS